MDVLTISRRLGHGSPSITLDVYGHRFKRKDDTAAAVFEERVRKRAHRVDASGPAPAIGYARRRYNYYQAALRQPFGPAASE